MHALQNSTLKEKIWRNVSRINMYHKKMGRHWPFFSFCKKVGDKLSFPFQDSGWRKLLRNSSGYGLTFRPKAQIFLVLSLKYPKV